MYCSHKGSHRLFKRKVHSTGQCVWQLNPFWDQLHVTWIEPTGFTLKAQPSQFSSYTPLTPSGILSPMTFIVKLSYDLSCLSYRQTLKVYTGFCLILRNGIRLDVILHLRKLNSSHFHKKSFQHIKQLKTTLKSLHLPISRESS